MFIKKCYFPNHETGFCFFYGIMEILYCLILLQYVGISSELVFIENDTDCIASTHCFHIIFSRLHENDENDLER